METCQFVKVDVRDRLAVLTLCRPQTKNAITAQMYDDITKCLESFSDDSEVTMTVITGTGEYYSSGTDLKEALAQNVDSGESPVRAASVRLQRFVEAFINHKKVLVAVVNGPAVGIAVTTLGLCDVVYSVDSATFQTPFTSLGMAAEGCSSYTFPRIMGTAKANDMLLLNHKMTAREAFEAGLVTRLFSKDQMETTVWPELRRKAQEFPVKSLMYSKELIRHFDLDKLHEANRLECRRLEERWTSEDCMNAIMAFMSRRSKM